MKIAVVHDDKINAQEMKMIEDVKKAIEKEHNVDLVEFDNDFIKNIKEFDFVFNLSTHGGKETRQVYVPALLDKLGIPYTSSNAYTHGLCMNKKITKLILNFHKIPVPKFFDPENYDGERFIVKPSSEGSAKGITKESVVSGIDNIKRKIKEVEEEFEGEAIAEEFIEGRELTVGIIGNGEDLEVLPILEIDFSTLPEGLERFYSFRVKHNYGEKTNYVCPARIDEGIRKKIEKYAKKAYKVLGLKDYARIDVRLNGSTPYFIEVNSMPQLVNVYSDITKMAKVAGYSYDELILKILHTSFKRYNIM